MSERFHNKQISIWMAAVFLLWQCAYAEFYFTDVLWPDFTSKELDKAIAAYRDRDRRYGGVKNP